jgi:DNA methylase
VYDVTTPHAQFALAVELNSQHGYQLSAEDKKQCAIRLYELGDTQDTISKQLSVRKDTVSDWLSRTVKEKKDREDQRILDLWFACRTQQEIAETIALDQSNIARRVEDLCAQFRGNQTHKILFQDWIADSEIPLYNIWKQQDKSAGVGHFGNSEPRWLENLLYLYTEPFDIIVDPFAGGGSTIDVCKRRGRRYFVSDRKPIVAREQEIRAWDLTDGLPKGPRWQDVRLVYLDPPYWKQAAGRYSEDPTDLANMELEPFHRTLAGLITAFGKKLSGGARIALLLQPTQWHAPERHFTDHVGEMLRRVKLPVSMRISCPYESQQCTAQMVQYAQEYKTVLVLTRELLVWEVA